MSASEENFEIFPEKQFLGGSARVRVRAIRVRRRVRRRDVWACGCMCAQVRASVCARVGAWV